MDPHWVRRTWWAAAVGLVVLGSLAPAARAGLRPKVDPSQVLPLDQVTEEHRAEVTEVIRDNTFHRQGKAETFPCHARVYLSLVNEPALTLALWQDLSTTPAKLQQVGPDQYRGTDGSGTTATWRYVLRSPKLHVLLCNLEYVGPRGNAKLNGRIVLIVRTGYFKEVNGDPWIQHEVEAYVKIDSKGWKAVAATVRPLIERVLEDQVEEAGYFISLMGRLVAAYPDWATQVAAAQAQVRPEIRADFRDLIARTRKPGAFTGRPVPADNADAKAPPTRTR
jgi:hypothetical protein